MGGMEDDGEQFMDASTEFVDHVPEDEIGACPRGTPLVPHGCADAATPLALLGRMGGAPDSIPTRRTSRG